MNESNWGKVFLGSNSESGEKAIIKIYDRVFIFSGNDEIEATQKIGDHANIVKYLKHGVMQITDAYGD